LRQGTSLPLDSCRVMCTIQGKSPIEASRKVVHANIDQMQLRLQRTFTAIRR
jgi:hypothetical protein